MSLLLVAGGVVVGAGIAGVACHVRFKSRLLVLTSDLEAERRVAAERTAYGERTEQLLREVVSLADSHRELGAHTQRLVDTMRSPVVRGQWGEMQLRRVLELAQMTEHVDYVMQGRVEARDSTARPDLTVLLPDDRVVVVDAKAPMDAFLDAMDEIDEAERLHHLRRHAKQVREQVTRLAAKGYWEQFRQSPEFVVLFLPGEALFAAALQCDASLIEYAATHRVILASPTTLIALLSGVARGWQQVAVSENTRALQETGRALYDQLRHFGAHHDAVRGALERAVESYNRSAAALESSVLPSARRFKDHGADTGHAIAAARPVMVAVRAEPARVGELPEVSAQGSV